MKEETLEVTEERRDVVDDAPTPLGQRQLPEKYLPY